MWAKVQEASSSSSSSSSSSGGGVKGQTTTTVFHGCSPVALRPGSLSILLAVSGSRACHKERGHRRIGLIFIFYIFLILCLPASLSACIPHHYQSATNHPSTPSSDPRLAHSDSLLAFVPLFRLLLQRDKGSLWTSESSLPAYCSATREDESRSQLGLYVHPRSYGRVARAVIVELSKEGERKSPRPSSPLVYIHVGRDFVFRVD